MQVGLGDPKLGAIGVPIDGRNRKFARAGITLLVACRAAYGRNEARHRQFETTRLLQPERSKVVGGAIGIGAQAISPIAGEIGATGLGGNGAKRERRAS